MYNTLSLLLLPDPLLQGVVVHVTVPSMGQINLFKSYSYSIEPCAQNPLMKQLHKK